MGGYEEAGDEGRRRQETRRGKRDLLEGPHEHEVE